LEESSECPFRPLSTGKSLQPNPHHAVSFSLCSCFDGHLWTVGYHVCHIYQTFIKF
jgi:hypothetical protein